jgi:hypothetical protein
VSARSPQEVLAQLGTELERARGARTGARLPRRFVLAVVIAVLSLGGTAVATRSIWAPDAPSTARHGPTAMIASGSLDEALWTLAARHCANGGVSVVLELRDGGAAGPCGPPGATPRVYVDPASGRAYAFGAAPAEVDEVSAGGVRGPLVHASGEAERRAGLPPGVAYFVVAIHSPQTAAGEVQFGCAQARCGF